MMNTPGVNISTIEDPVEYRVNGVNQTQTNVKAGMSFAAGLRALLRQDPNIIMVGEIRDGETADLAVQAALTGHVVLSTLHTNNAATTLPRLLDMGIEPFLIASTVNTVIGQRLVRRLCPVCRLAMCRKVWSSPTLSVTSSSPRSDARRAQGGGDRAD
jgi:type II secretory ATPase GspE/PulE/Tfp pilus assembly ATPase PilB-like protein